MRWLRAVGVAAVLLSCGAIAPARADDDPWADFRFLIGSWMNEGPPESGSGRFTLQPELDGKVLVRRHSANVPAANGRPAARHEDLMVIHPEPGTRRFRASYYDNEGHVIQYTVTPRDDGKALEFLSEPSASQPGFRLTYTPGEGDRVRVKFEIAPPGKTEFQTYLEGTVRPAKPGESPRGS